MRASSVGRSLHAALCAEAEDGVVLLVRVVVMMTDVVVQEPFQVVQRSRVMLLMSCRVGRVRGGRVARVAAKEARVGPLLVVAVLVRRRVRSGCGGCERV